MDVFDVQGPVFDILVNVIGSLVIVAGTLAIRELRRRFSLNEIRQAEQIADIVVRSAEQIGFVLGFDGREKLTLALRQAREIAEERGLALTDEQWRILIESAVQVMKALGQELHREEEQVDGVSQVDLGSA